MSIARPAQASCFLVVSTVGLGAGRPHCLGRGKARRAARVVALVAFAVMTPRVVRADEAETLREAGKQLMKEGKVAEACFKLEESHKMSPNGPSLLDLAACHEKQGKLVTAWSEYIDVGAEARKEGNKRIEAEAKYRGSKLECWLPRLALRVFRAAAVEGIELKLDDVSIDRSGWGQSRPLDPGEHTVRASAPGRKSWKYVVKVKAGDRKSAAVPVLGEGEGAEAASAEGAAGETPAGGAAGEVKASSGAGGQEGGAAKTEEPGAHRTSRWVADVGVGGGLLVGLIEAGTLERVSSFSYTYNILEDGTLSTLNVRCNEDVCHTGFDPAAGGFVGGQAFFGLAASDRLHVGARVLGGSRFGGGYLLVGGPSGAMRFGRLWVGLSGLVGGVSQTAKVTGIKGEIPADVVKLNYGLTEADVAGSGTLPETASVGTLAFGGSVEVSYALAEMRSSRWTSGAIVVSAWPTIMKGIEGFVIAAPVSLGYRFY